MTTFSDETILHKLGFQPGDSVFVETTPDWYTDFADSHELELEPGLPATHAHLFCMNKRELAGFLKDNNLKDIEKSLWVSWPAKTSSLQTDLSDSDIRSAITPLGWTADEAITLDDTWSGLKFLRRK
jgi:hypothetical protein